MSSAKEFPTGSSLNKRKYSEVVDLTEDEPTNQTNKRSQSSSEGHLPAKLISQTETSIVFEVFGQPEVLERHRISAHGHVYNPTLRVLYVCVAGSVLAPAQR